MLGRAMVKVCRSESRSVVSVERKRGEGAIMYSYASFSKCRAVNDKLVLMSEF